MNYTWAFGVCQSCGEGMVAGRMMRWEGLGSRVSLREMESSGWGQSSWQARDSPTCQLVYFPSFEWRNIYYLKQIKRSGKLYSIHILHKGFRILFLGKLDIFIQESNYRVLMSKAFAQDLVHRTHMLSICWDCVLLSFFCYSKMLCRYCCSVSQWSLLISLPL